MKIRNGFVSNSSSSSFVVQKRMISTEQFIRIFNHIEEAQKMGWNAQEEDGWSITESYDTIKLYTIIDNFDMEVFFEAIGVPRDAYEETSTPIWMT